MRPVYAVFVARARVLAAVILVAITSAAVVGLTRLRFNDSYRDLFRSTDPAYTAMMRAAEQFGADDQYVVLLIEGDDLLKPEVIAAERQFRQTILLEVDGISAVYSALDAQ